MQPMGLSEVLARIAEVSRESHRSVVPTLMAVSKTQPFEKLHRLYLEGQKIFGENYVQELIDKKTQFESLGFSDADLQFIGHLQTNKVKGLLPFVSTIHSVDSLRLLQEIEKRAALLQKKIGCYFQINIDREDSKGGFLESDLSELSESVATMEWVTPLGLMCIPDPEKDVDAAFANMQSISLRYSENLGAGLSMGMSSDFEIAIQRGATSVRIGSALFGSRTNYVPK